jgi:hypothetical protein
MLHEGIAPAFPPETNLPEMKVVRYDYCLLPYYLLPPEVQARG